MFSHSILIVITRKHSLGELRAVVGLGKGEGEGGRFNKGVKKGKNEKMK